MDSYAPNWTAEEREQSKHYDYDEDVLVLRLTGELEREYPNLDWSNVMTDSWPLRPEQA
jgi:hypothetical protein